MLKHRWLALVAGTALLMGGCDSLSSSGEGDTAPTAPEASPAGVPAGVPEAAAPTPVATAASPTPLPRSAVAANGLIPVTNPQDRLRSIQPGITTGRSDPFATVAVSPVAIPVAAPAAVNPVPRVIPRSVPRDVEDDGGNDNNTDIPSPAVVPVRPPEPQPVLAPQVAVTGIVQLPAGVYALVRAPQESTSRYVRVGERFSDGNLLLKRVDMNRFPRPVAVIEEVGKEVEREVGSQPVGAQQGA
ncbi:hypothetical protein [Leptolyngbya sp. FACHB-261]|uniref:hypothetical protein n=1 Tax=Leptolyngbya sp. FACHB-261 TaxID=2692806 RepID=UPI0016847B79|nr:hypothetical protein [Leptolyngbya sp. FACHB-261]MBD2100715.1 hypothetical protein [Leptolyngbya sp. FACHB-261]